MSDGANGSAILNAGNPAGDGAAGGGNGGAGAGNPTGGLPDGGQGGGTPHATGSWLDTIEDTELKGYVQNKGWKDPRELADGYRNLEKLLGGEKLPLPKGEDDAEGWSRVYDSLGRPQAPDAYKIPTMGDGQDQFVKDVQSKFHELGLSEKQGNALAEWYHGVQKGMVDQTLAGSAQKAEADLSALKQEWGGAYDENIELGRRAAREYGMDESKLTKIEQALGTGEMLKLFAQIGRSQGEASFNKGDGGSGNFGMTPAQAQARISELKADKGWTQKYVAGDADARAEFARLHQLAFPE